MSGSDGPSLETYVETRLNLLTEEIRKDKQEQDRFLSERDRRYEERHGANEQALSKVATEMLAKFAAVNEFRGAMGDAQREFIPRAEVEAIVTGLKDQLGTISLHLDRIQTERQGIKGGYGYAVGIVGLVAALVSIGVAIAKLS
jgi:hypothetical protein